ncbi:MAG: TPM domain-containing protein [Lachnospiraceae bacterium]|nr:TPM domain-containing protein [Lachnospiraceae bacterium]
MKKRCRQLILLLVLALLVLPLFSGAKAQAATGHLEDRANLFSFEGKLALESKMAELESTYGTKVFILTVYKLEDEALPNSYTGIRAFTEDYYDYVVCGGVETTGLILCVDMGGREMWVSTTGEEVARFQSDIDYLLDRVAARLSDGEYDSAGSQFLKLIEQKHKLGFYPPTFGKILISLLIGLFVGLIVLASLRSQLKTVHQATSARNYAVPGSFHLRRVDELYLYSSVTQTAKPQPSDRIGGGSGGGFGGGGGMSGFSHGGGGRTF